MNGQINLIINLLAFKGNKEPRYYQDVAITSVLDAIAENKKEFA